MFVCLKGCLEIDEHPALFRSDYDSLNKELRAVKERLQTSESVVENQKRELANIRAESANRKRELQDVSLSLRKSQLSNAEYISKLRQLRECQSPRVDEKESSFLRSKIDELRTWNGQLFDAVQKTEETTNILGTTKRDYEEKLKKQEKIVEDLLRKTFPDTPDCQNFFCPLGRVPS